MIERECIRKLNNGMCYENGIDCEECWMFEQDISKDCKMRGMEEPSREDVSKWCQFHLKYCSQCGEFK